MKKQQSLLFLLLLSVQLAIAQTTRYEYWLDNGYDERTIAAYSQQSDVTFDMDITGLKPGLHFFNFRTQSTSGQWGGLSRNLFMLTEGENGTATMTRYEYWLDNNYAQRTIAQGSTFSSPMTLDLTDVKPGLHYFNFRTQSTSGQWGGLSRYLFFVKDISLESLKAINYWIDNGSRQAQQVTDSVIVITVDISDLADGEHTFYMEGRDAQGATGLLNAYEFHYTAPQGEATFDGRVATVSGERTLDEAFKQAGGRSEAAKTITAIVWEKETPLTADMLQDITNPNLLIYVSDAALAPQSVQNVVVAGTAERITLTDDGTENCDFYAPQAFTAEQISYTRDFRQTTQVGVSRGWEALALPFSVQTITHEARGPISPFGSNDSNKHFWLRRLSPDGLTSVTAIEANTPYVISMPNDRGAYLSGNCLNGRVTFSATHAAVSATQPVVTALADSSIVMQGALQRIDRSSAVWALNVGEARGPYVEGSVFERDYREVRPFEAYTVHRGEGGEGDQAPRYVPVNDLQDGGATAIETVSTGDSPARDGQWYTVDGRRLPAQPEHKGLYIKGRRKVVIK